MCVVYLRGPEEGAGVSEGPALSAATELRSSEDQEMLSTSDPLLQTPNKLLRDGSARNSFTPSIRITNQLLNLGYEIHILPNSS